ncbi:hypothetical protein, partial [Asanoa sp. NPDC050611]|uniref:hypothetical protein n=1 Tax=Asanoa sp. NPDC050611 TaxID=3157098 RepID=UPI0033EC1B87
TPDDLFCAGHVQLSDGKVLVMGGNKAYPTQLWGVDRETHAETAGRLRSRLGPEPYGRLTAHGAGLALHDVIELAVGTGPGGRTARAQLST